MLSCFASQKSIRHLEEAVKLSSYALQQKCFQYNASFMLPPLHFGTCSKSATTNIKEREHYGKNSRRRAAYL
jgi:hypothetical protein